MSMLSTASSPSASTRDAATAHARRLIQQALQGCGWANEPHDAPETLLTGVAAAHLFELDQRLRYWDATSFQQWPQNEVPATDMALLGTPLVQALVWLSCAQRNGHLRAVAVQRLVHAPGRLSLCAALIRSVDWSPHVCAHAQAAVPVLLDTCTVDEVVASWSLVLRLQARGRLDVAWFEATVYGWLKQPAQQAVLQALLCSDDDAVRVWAHRWVLEAALPWADGLAFSAIADRHPEIALHAIRHALRTGPDAACETIARRGLQSPHAPVRREALRACVAAQGEGWIQTVHAHLLDRSAAVRSVAAFVLGDRLASSPLPHWRQALDAAIDRPPITALAALADRAEAEDAPRFLRWMPEAIGTVRWHAVRGLVRTGGIEAPAVLAMALAGGNGRIMRVLREAVAQGQILLDVPTVQALWATGMLDAGRQATLARLLAQLAHWRRLQLVLTLLPQATLPEAWRGQLVADWVDDSGCYAPLGALQREALLTQVAACAPWLDPASSALMTAALRRH